MDVSASLDSGDERHSYICYVFDNLNAFVVYLAPDDWVGDIIERREIDSRNELAACSCQDDDLVRAILRNPVKGIDKFGVILCCESERTTITVELGKQHAVGISSEPEAAIGIEVVRMKCIHRIPLSVLVAELESSATALSFREDSGLDLDILLHQASDQQLPGGLLFFLCFSFTQSTHRLLQG
jgi:hypothetical protein